MPALAIPIQSARWSHGATLTGYMSQCSCCDEVMFVILAPSEPNWFHCTCPHREIPHIHPQLEGWIPSAVGWLVLNKGNRNIKAGSWGTRQFN